MALAVVFAGVLAASDTGSAFAADGCPNASVRAAQNAGHLPGCRAWEMVSPLEKGGLDVAGESIEDFTQAATDGSAIAFSSYASFGDAVGGAFQNIYRASRQDSGWTTTTVSPSQRASYLSGLGGGQTSVVNALDDDLTTAVVRTNMQLDPAATPLTESLYLRDIGADTYRLLTPGLPTDVGAPNNKVPRYRAATPDDETIVFNSSKVLVAGAPAGSTVKAYAVRDGQYELVSYLPTGTPSTGAVGAPGYSSAASSESAVSDDGRLVYWVPASGPGLYVRDLQADTTTQVSPSARFVAARPDGSRVIYQGVSQTCMYDQVSNTSDCVGTAGAAGSAAYVLAATDDLSSIYVLTGAGGVTGHPPPAGSHGLYRIQPVDGSMAAARVDLIASMSSIPAGDDLLQSSFDIATDRRTAWSADGETFAFSTAGVVTGFDTAGTRQVYLFDGDEGDLVCASCPVGAPSSSATLGSRNIAGGGLAQMPLPHKIRALSNDGRRLFFTTGERLTPRDVNGREDVYMWEAGELSLLSTGTSDFDAKFLDASASGDDVFLVTRARLSGHDTDDLADVYDVRVGGGLPEPKAVSSCEGDGCQERAGSEPARAALGSENLRGVGDLVSKPRACVALRVRVTRLSRSSVRFSRRARRLSVRSRRATGRREVTLRLKARKARQRAKTARGKARRVKKRLATCGAGGRS